jgi:membrane fusion protein, copper/silver efflux system
MRSGPFVSWTRLVILAVAVVAVMAPISQRAFTAARQAARAQQEGEWTCPMHPDVHQSHPGRCPICGMELERKTPAAAAEAHGEAHESRAETANPPRPGVTAPPHEDLADPRAPIEIDARRRQLLGVRLAPVEQATLTRSIHVTGIVKFDESRWNDVTLRLEGYVRDLYVDRTGQMVRKGQPLFSFYSPDLTAAIAEYRLATSSRAALGHSTSGDTREHADRLVEAARLRLTRWQVDEEQLQAALTADEPRTVFRSPASGIVMEKTIVRGMRAMPGDVLYRIVDPTAVWVEAGVHESDLGAVRVGQRGAIAFQAYPGETLTGRVTFIAPQLDEQTRTAFVRFALANPGGRLKAGMFAAVDLTVPLGRGLAIPSDAVLDSGRRQLVFVSEGDGYFEPRGVTVGHTEDGRTQILSGLTEGERVAESAAFFIDSESQLRAATTGYAAKVPPSPAATPSASRPSIELTTLPDPLKAGPATLTATVRQADGTPITDAAVTVVFAMAAMPSMNMPAMRSEAQLGGVGNGAYRGPVDILMTGRWDVTVIVTRGGERVGSKQLTLIAR